jgi:hypothetical protein
VEYLGWYGRDVVPDGPGRCIWPLASDSVESLFIALMWLPRGIRYRVEAEPDVLAFLAEQGDRFTAASAAGTAS